MNTDSGAQPELSVAQVLQLFLPEYLQTHAVPVHHVKVLQRLGACRSGQLGYSLWRCQDCPGLDWQPNVCGDRHCPSCQHHRSSQWLEKQRNALLPVRYFHWVFTLPALLRPLALQNPKAIYDLLFDSASATLLEFGRQRFHAQIGLTALLHTWGQNLFDHPHLHCLVTGGGLTDQLTWAGPKQARWLFPIAAIGQMFRGKFCAGLLRLHTTGQLQFHGQLQPLQNFSSFTAFLRKIKTQKWNVFAKGSVIGPEAVLQYLGRYTHRVAISNSRLRQIDPVSKTVRFLFKDYADGDRIKTLVLTAQEFIRRLRLHILPAGFTKIRHYGLLGNNRRITQIPKAREALKNSALFFQPTSPLPQPTPVASDNLGPSCPFCQEGRMRCVGRQSASGKLILFALSILHTIPGPAPDTS